MAFLVRLGDFERFKVEQQKVMKGQQLLLAFSRFTVRCMHSWRCPGPDANGGEACA